jgi:hypothetical protein
VRVIKGGENVRFARESRAALGIGGEQRRQDLQRDLAPSPQVTRAIDLADAACAEWRARQSRKRRDRVFRLCHE